MQSKLSDFVDKLSVIIKKNARLHGKKKILSLIGNLLDLKMIYYITDAKNVKKDVLSQKMD